MRLGPVTFLLLVPAIWSAVRAVMLWPQAEPKASRHIAWSEQSNVQKPHFPSSTPSAVEARRSTAPMSTNASRLRAQRSARPERLEPHPVLALRDPLDPPHYPAQRDVAHPLSPRPQPPAPSGTKRLTISTWLLGRGRVSPGLATAGQLGGSQAGLRARYAVSKRVHLAARLSGPVQSRRGKEAAIALDVRPLVTVPIILTMERRIGLDRGGRDAFAIGAFGGFDRRLAPRLRLDAYAQAGVVGLKRRDAYVDGALRAERTLTATGNLGVGAGIWGGAQPGAARVDVGPQLVARIAGVRIGAEWRQRVAGNAQPGSGPVVTLGADF